MSKQLFLKSVFFLPEYDELLELLSVVLCVFKELMLKKLGRLASFFRVFVQALSYEILEDWRPFGILKSWSFLGNNQIEHLLLWLADIRRLAIGKFQSEDSETPNVYFLIVLSLASDQLWGHPAYSSYLTGSSCSLLCQLSCVTEISKLQVSLLVDEDVIGLDISMDNVFGVKIGKSLESLVKNVRAHSFRDISLSLFDNWCEASSIHELKENPKSLSVVVSLEASNYILVVLTHLHDSKFVLNNLSLFLVLRFYEFEGTLRAIILLLYKEDSSESSISNLLNNFVELRRVILKEHCMRF